MMAKNLQRKAERKAARITARRERRGEDVSSPEAQARIQGLANKRAANDGPGTRYRIQARRAAAGKPTKQIQPRGQGRAVGQNPEAHPRQAAPQPVIDVQRPVFTGRPTDEEVFAARRGAGRGDLVRTIEPTGAVQMARIPQPAVDQAPQPVDPQTGAILPVAQGTVVPAGVPQPGAPAVSGGQPAGPAGPSTVQPAAPAPTQPVPVAQQPVQAPQPQQSPAPAPTPLPAPVPAPVSAVAGGLGGIAQQFPGFRPRENALALMRQGLPQFEQFGDPSGLQDQNARRLALLNSRFGSPVV